MKIKFSGHWNRRWATSALIVTLLVVTTRPAASLDSNETATKPNPSIITTTVATPTQSTSNKTSPVVEKQQTPTEIATPPKAADQIAIETTSTATTTPTSPTTTLASSTVAPLITTTPASSNSTDSHPSSPSQEDPTKVLQEIKRIIQLNREQPRIENRLAMNKPTMQPHMTDFAQDSAEAKAASATTQFGLNFMKNLPNDVSENVVLSPLSLQNLLSMILLGSGDNSTTQQELAQVLGFAGNGLLEQADSRLKPHEAMRSVLQSILDAIHLPVSQLAAGASSPLAEPSELLNANLGALNASVTEQTKSQLVGAHLQTSLKEGDVPLSGQLNFTLANLVLTNKDKIELKADFEKELKSYYNVKVEEFSRETDKEGASKTELPLHERVNKWVRESTQNQIERLAEEADLSGDNLIMVLLNAAHFKGRWLHTFNTKATHERTFFNGGSEQMANKAVKFMRQKGVFGYADFGTAASPFGEDRAQDGRVRASEDLETLLTEDAIAKQDSGSESSQRNSPPHIELSREEARRLELTSKLNCSALMLPFSLNDGQELSMVFLLPAKRDGIAELQAALDEPALGEVYRSLSEQQVQVEMPKFSLEASHDAKSILSKMGLKTVLGEGTSGANFDRMYSVKSGNDGVAKVDKIIHKAKINVDESGAEAAAASMASIVLRNFIRPPTPMFVADHPFLFVIRHNRSNMPLFMGRVSSL